MNHTTVATNNNQSFKNIR